MIVSRREEGLVLVRQVDHQDQCAAIARAWGNRDFARPQPYEELMTAAAVHDEGWRSWEAAPGVNGDGAPIDFAEIDRTVHVGLYRVGIEGACARGPRVGLLVSMHGAGLYERRRGLDDGPVPHRGERPPPVERFLFEQHALQERLREGIGGGPALEEWSWAAYRLLQAWDVMSLYLTWRLLAEGREITLPKVPRRAGDPGVGLALRPAGPWACSCSPWPFAGAEVELPVAARVLPDRRFADAADLARSIAAAPVRSLPFRVLPG